jgi:hypothetical protein
VPVGFVITAALVIVGLAVSVWPPSRSGLPGLLVWLVIAIPNESQFLAFYWRPARRCSPTAKVSSAAPPYGRRSPGSRAVGRHARPRPPKPASRDHHAPVPARLDAAQVRAQRVVSGAVTDLKQRAVAQFRQ